MLNELLEFIDVFIFSYLEFRFIPMVSLPSSQYESKSITMSISDSGDFDLYLFIG